MRTLGRMILPPSRGRAEPSARSAALAGADPTALSAPLAQTIAAVFPAGVRCWEALTARASCSRPPSGPARRPR